MEKRRKRTVKSNKAFEVRINHDCFCIHEIYVTVVFIHGTVLLFKQK